MKIYTKTGDEGTTSLFGGKRVHKDDIRIEAYGTVDELNTFIGLLLTTIFDKDQKHILTAIQNRLFTIGSNLASDPEKQMITPDISEQDIQLLEQAMDNMDNDLLPLRNFILPGGSLSVSYAHICRTICRRAERRVVTLNRESSVDQRIEIYLNRLSDYFFVLSRWLAHIENVKEVLWVSR